MKKMDLNTIARITEAKIFSEKQTEFSGIATDTRKSMQGQLFIALKGDSFDAHDFCEQAVQQGAAGILIHRLPQNLESIRSKVSVLVVKDTLTALQEIAHFARHQSSASVLAITGSNGKTTSKEFTAAILSPYKKIHYSKGSFNNHWGLPFSILEEPAGTEITILEMGMNHKGEIEQLCKIADPDVVVVSMVGRAHIEHFGEVAKIAEAKEEIYKFAPAQARRVYNLDNPWTMKMYLRARTEYPKADRLISFSQMNPKADIFFELEEVSVRDLKIKGKILKTEGTATIPVFGAQNLTNLMVGASVALAAGLTPEQIWQALPQCRTNWGRNQILKNTKGGEILFDGYNANPDSMEALLANVPLIKSEKKFAVLAEMLELGEIAAQAHFDLGKSVATCHFDQVYFYGKHAEDFKKGYQTVRADSSLQTSNDFDSSLANKIASQIAGNSFTVVKGSRGMKLEQFVQLCDVPDFKGK